ncbi:interleukin-18 receptor 1 [Suncus etruscus]|uniref:interleukin-18 receptor 1 n=1 Tax=Suncus etruscus TaxID=109475 RepID=UPI0021108FE7|nr:interleukin-18 receptor 1 [Suncus etruscus]
MARAQQIGDTRGMCLCYAGHLCFMRTTGPEQCIFREHISELEGEFFYLKPCIDPSPNELSTVKWYKKNESLGLVELPSSNSSRIILRNKSLEFWPLELGDRGSYMFCMGLSLGQFQLPPNLRNATVGVDCEKIKSGESFIEKSATYEDQGYYTCVYSLHLNGKPFNFTKTYNVTITEGQDLIHSYFHGPNPEYIKVELGKDVLLNCSASADNWSLFEWKFNSETHHNAEEKELTTFDIGKNQKHMSQILEIKNINEKNLNTPYVCMISGKIKENKTFILLKKEEPDISNHVFKRGMIITVFISMAIVCLVILGIIYRVDLTLFYRHFMRRDETLTDGKTYDAFVSYLKNCQPENGEAHTFAVEILPKVLEKHFGYKLCIFERDVVPGKAVVDEIHSLIEKSRRLIIVLNKSYMSNEVRYELESGLHEALVERKIKIILIKFASVSDFSFLPQSLELLKSHRVLKWKADKSLSYNSRFWKNLLYLMPAKVVKPCRDESVESFPFFQDSELRNLNK